MRRDTASRRINRLEVEGAHRCVESASSLVRANSIAAQVISLLAEVEARWSLRRFLMTTTIYSHNSGSSAHRFSSSPKASETGGTNRLRELLKLGHRSCNPDHVRGLIPACRGMGLGQSTGAGQGSAGTGSRRCRGPAGQETGGIGRHGATEQPTLAKLPPCAASRSASCCFSTPSTTVVKPIWSASRTTLAWRSRTRVGVRHHER